MQRATDNRDDWWWSGAMRAVQQLADTGGTFEAYDVTLLGVSDPDHPNRWGALFRSAVTAGIIRRVGYAPSRRPSRAAGVVGLYRGAR